MNTYSLVNGFAARLAEKKEPVSGANHQATKCVVCKEPFSHANCFTIMGWRETKISGFCEKCFDENCKE